MIQGHPSELIKSIKQGGILSPSLFTVYIDDLLKKLRASGIGCHILSIFLAAIMFADNLALLAPTRGAMQEMILICHKYHSEYFLTCNAKKTKSMIFGDGPSSLDPEPLNILTSGPTLVALFKQGNTSAFLVKMP